MNNQQNDKSAFPLFKPGFGLWEVVGILFFIILISTFLVIGVKPFLLIPKAMSAKKWTTIEGKLDSWKSRRKGSSTSTNVKHAQVITCSYIYVVEGKKYPGSRVYIKEYDDDYDCGSRKEAEALMNSLVSKDNIVLIHYNPQNPNESVLIPKISPELWTVSILCFIPVIVLCGAAIWIIRVRKKNKQFFEN